MSNDKRTSSVERILAMFMPVLYGSLAFRVDIQLALQMDKTDDGYVWELLLLLALSIISCSIP